MKKGRSAANNSNTTKVIAPPKPATKTGEAYARDGTAGNAENFVQRAAHSSGHQRGREEIPRDDNLYQYFPRWRLLSAQPAYRKRFPGLCLDHPVWRPRHGPAQRPRPRGASGHGGAPRALRERSSRRVFRGSVRREPPSRLWRLIRAPLHFFRFFVRGVTNL